MLKHVVIKWENGPVEGFIKVIHGQISEAEFVHEEGQVQADHFKCIEHGPCELFLSINGSDKVGAMATRISIIMEMHSFTFFLRDVDRAFPIWIPEYGVAVSTREDGRTYAHLSGDIRALKLTTNLQKIENEPEAKYQDASLVTRQKNLSTWLGLGRDIRLFGIGFAEYDLHSHDWIEPRLHKEKISLPEGGETPVRYNFRIGRGDSCTRITKRRLEEGVIPIVHGEIDDGDIVYRTTTFVTLEQSTLTAENVRGTQFWVASGHTEGITFTDEQLKLYEHYLPDERQRPEETVLCYRIEAKNSSAVPRYAWFKAPVPNGTWVPSVLKNDIKWQYNAENGFGIYDSGRVGFIVLLDGKPASQQEMAILVKPGEAVVFDILVPNQPISQARAALLAVRNIAELHQECRSYWLAKLETAAKVDLPETRISEMVKAGLLHLDLIVYGLEPDGPVTPTIGVYPPIGSESAPIIQFMDSMGWHKLAERSLMYFLEKQQIDGAIFNFLEYMIETGCVLWSLGEHYRYTRNNQWVRDIKPKLLKSCNYILEWRKRNKQEIWRDSGYGMLDGKVADPEDELPVRVYMLNAYAYLGLSRAAEMLAELDPELSRMIHAEAEAFKVDIRLAYEDGIANGPVVPLGNGAWSPTISPWAGGIGPACLFADGGQFYTHGAVNIRDSLCGPLYLVFGEVVDANEAGASFMLNVHNELMCVRNVALTQPYYSRHSWIHLQRGEAKPFLEAYYYAMSAMADKETYTFSEHLNAHISEHKTHEEAWFLMETRWMLYLEVGSRLKLLQGIPRDWMNAGQHIEVVKAASYFGQLSFRIDSELNLVKVKIKCEAFRHLESIEIRIPHPQFKKPVHVQGGVYHEASETVYIATFNGYSELELKY